MCSIHRAAQLILSLLVSGCWPVQAASAESVLRLAPSEHLYPLYLADPLRATFSMQTMYFGRTSIANTSRRRFDLKVGGELNLFELREAPDGMAWLQVFLEGGFHGQFDADQSEDNIGWDGIYSIYVSLREHERLAYRIGIKHISSHIGDELIERSGRTRLNYTRQEVRVGIAWRFVADGVAYFDAGYGHDLRNPIVQAPWRLQAGLQYLDPKVFWQNRLGWFAALDISSYEENDWAYNRTLQFGLSLSRDERLWRIGVEYYRGRAQLGEFFRDSENYIGLGLWVDI